MKSQRNVVILNGFPGVGKLTIARRLSELLPDSKLFDNHLLIDAASALYEREDEAFQPLRHALRQTIFSSLITNPSSRPEVIIFTECQSTDLEGSAVMSEYASFARTIQAKLMSVVIQCSEEANEARLVHLSRTKKGSTKLTDVDVLRAMRERAVIHRFGGLADAEWVIDTTSSSAEAVAEELNRRISVASNS